MYTVSWTLQYPSSDLFSIQPAPWPRLMTFAECGSIIHHQAAGLWEWEARGGGQTVSLSYLLFSLGTGQGPTQLAGY